MKPSDDVPRELAAAMAETRVVREKYATLCEEFGPSPQSGMSARISMTVLGRHREAAGLPALPRTVLAAEREDTMLRYRRERDEAREQLAKQDADFDARLKVLDSVIAERDEARRRVAELEQSFGEVIRITWHFAGEADRLRIQAIAARELEKARAARVTAGDGS